MYEVTTNNERFITDATTKTLNKWMFNYIKKQLKKGMKLHKVIFNWKPIHFVPSQSKKFTK